jgi:hypothetical protein
MAKASGENAGLSRRFIVLTETLRGEASPLKTCGLSDADRSALIAATETAKQRMQIFDRDSWPKSERDHGPVHNSVVIAEWLAIHGLSAQRGSAGRG